MTTMDSQEPPAVKIAPAWLLNEVGANMQLPYKAHFGGAKFYRGRDQLMYGSLPLLHGAHKLVFQQNFQKPPFAKIETLEMLRYTGCQIFRSVKTTSVMQLTPWLELFTCNFK